MHRHNLSRLLLLAALGLLNGCVAFTEHRVGTNNGSLIECPQWPRCVSSQTAQPEKQIAPFTIQGDAQEAWRTAQGAVAAMPRTTIVDERPRYLRAEVVSPWGVYTDDLELLLKPAAGLIHVRSTGRIGYYDFNVNRDRVEALRSTLIERGVVSR